MTRSRPMLLAVLFTLLVSGCATSTPRDVGGSAAPAEGPLRPSRSQIHDA